MSKKTFELIPMTPEKAKILALACKQWNEYMSEGIRARKRYFLRQNATHYQWGKRARYSRSFILGRKREKRKILEALARHAINKGMFGDYIYLPKTRFFLHEKFWRWENGILWLKLIPGTEVGFKTPELPGEIHELRLYQRGLGKQQQQQWYADFYSDD